MKPETISLVVKQNGKDIFTHSGSWLHPLFELEKFLDESGIDPASLFLQDKIVGRAAALLIVGMGIPRVKALTLSVLGKEVFEENSVVYEYDTLVDRILCRTERMLAETSDPLEARSLLFKLLKESGDR